MGVEFSSIHQLPPCKFPSGLGDRLEGLRSTTLGKRLKRGLSKEAKQKIKRILLLLRQSGPSAGPAPPGQPHVARSDWHLQNTRHKLPTAKFAGAFGHLNRFTFEDAMNLTGQWLSFAGYANPWSAGAPL
jgi:hypothetical protein